MISSQAKILPTWQLKPVAVEILVNNRSFVATVEPAHAADRAAKLLSSRLKDTVVIIRIGTFIKTTYINGESDGISNARIVLGVSEEENLKYNIQEMNTGNWI